MSPKPAKPLTFGGAGRSALANQPDAASVKAPVTVLEPSAAPIDAAEPEAIEPTPAPPAPRPQLVRNTPPRSRRERRPTPADTTFVLGELRALPPYERVTIGVSPDTKQLLDAIRRARRWSATEAVLNAVGHWLADGRPADHVAHDTGRLMVHLHLGAGETAEIDQLARDVGLSRSALLTAALHTSNLV